MFEPVKSWSLPDHLYMVSAWSAKCRTRSPMSCVNNIIGPLQRPAVRQRRPGRGARPAGPTSTWPGPTSPGCMYTHHVSWRVLRADRLPARLRRRLGRDLHARSGRAAATPGIWNPLPLFGDVQHDHQQGNIQELSDYFAAAKSGHLPAVSWITPSQTDSEHPPASVHQGQAYVTAIINAAMKSPDWKSTAIFLSWDDWGGFYDNVVPPRGRPERLRPARPRPGHLALRQARLHRPPDATAATPT